MTHRAFLLAAGFAAALTTSPAIANEFEPALQELATTTVAEMVTNPIIVEAIKAQNAKNAGLSQGDIDALDKKWRAEVGASSTPTIDPVLNSAVADFLREQAEASEGVFTEIFVMDNHGLNVAASDTTSDYWQGDEAKWQKTYGAGAGAVLIGDVELDESTQSYQSQISVSIVDPATGEPIGAATFGVSVEMLN